jgi:hypothetical protein
MHGGTGQVCSMSSDAQATQLTLALKKWKTSQDEARQASAPQVKHELDASFCTTPSNSQT